MQADVARLDTKGGGLGRGSRFEATFFDLRVLNPYHAFDGRLPLQR